MLRAIKENKAEKRQQVVYSYKMIREFFETMPSQERFLSDKGISHVDVLGKNVPGRENKTDKGRKRVLYLICMRSSKGASVVKTGEQGKDTKRGEAGLDWRSWEFQQARWLTLRWKSIAEHCSQGNDMNACLFFKIFDSKLQHVGSWFPD